MLNISTTQAVKDRNLANLESKLGQTSPLADKAFLRVLAAMEAMNHTELYKYAAERALQNFVLTATGDDLDIAGIEFKTPRKVAEAAVLEISLPAANGTVIPASVDFIGDSNQMRYFPNAGAIAAGGVAILTVTAENVGVAGNLNVGETLSIGTQIAGAETTATVTTVNNVGTEKETDTAYRPRILAAIRTNTGGGNAADYKTWAEEVAGVYAAYPYAGKPSGGGTSYPGDRTVYVEADTAIDPDGIAPQSLLDEVRDSLNTDPDDSESRPPLGLINATLYVESIYRTPIYVEVRSLVVSADVEAQVKSDIEDALTTYLLSIKPYLPGIDILTERNDSITDLTVSDIVQDILTANGGSAQGVGFGPSVGVFYSIYFLNPGELTKLGGVNYA